MGLLAEKWTMPTGDTTIKKNAPDGLYCIFRFAHKKPDMYRHTFASHVCTGQDRKKCFHQNIGKLQPHILHHSEIEIFFVCARIIRKTEKPDTERDFGKNVKYKKQKYYTLEQ